MRALWLVMMAVFAGCPPAPMGSKCAQHTDCRFMAEGYCSRAEICTRVCDQAACPDGYRCSSEGSRRVCLPVCGDGVGCFDGFVCGEGETGPVCRLSLEAALKKLPSQ